MTDGVVLYDKPAGVTSHDVVARMRRALGARRRGPARLKVGHAGTLDPFATGLLLVLLGRGTRVQRFLMELPKTYFAVARFGAVSSTGDPEGEIALTGVVPDGDLVLPVGQVRQRPPAYSAVKVGGRRAYELARAGEAVELAEREVTVYRFEERWRSAERRAFVIECSSGTYVRSLIAELGDAYCEELRRVRIGPFDVADSDPERIVALGDALAFLPEVRLDPELARRAGHGGAVAAPGAGGGVVGGGGGVVGGGGGVVGGGGGGVGGGGGGVGGGGGGVGGGGGGVGGGGGGVGGGGGGSGVVRLTDEHGLIALAEPRPDGTLAPVVGLRG